MTTIEELQDQVDGLEERLNSLLYVLSECDLKTSADLSHLLDEDELDLGEYDEDEDEEDIEEMSIDDINEDKEELL